MLDFLRAKHSRILVWTLLVLLVVGLAGFGISNTVGLGSDSVASVGDTEISSADYSRAMDQEMRTLTSQIGRPLPMSEARQYGIDNVVLSRLVGDAALDEEARRLGISVGDTVVAEQVLGETAFQGPDGKFDRDTYALALRGIGLTPSQFEAQLRREAARELVASAAQSAVPAPAETAEVMLRFLGERRGFDWVRIDAGMLTAPVPVPTDAELEEEYKAHPEAYTTPETRRITYAAVTPAELAKTIEVPEADLRAAYEAAGAKYATPERRVLERIGFATDADAAAAKARLDAGEVTFDALATERGLGAAEIDQGAVTADRLSPEARAAVFGAPGQEVGPGIIGPVPTPLGPSIYRLNAVLNAHTVPFEEARAELVTERALKMATDQIAAESAGIEDLVAGGATLEEIVAESNLTLGTVAFNAASKDGIAADAAFGKAALAAEPGTETDVFALADGGIATLRVEAVDAPALRPLDEVRGEVAAAWTAAETGRRLDALARGYAGELDAGLSFADLAARLNLLPNAVAPVARGESPRGVPPSVVVAVFDAPEGGSLVVPDAGGPILAKVGAVVPFDAGAEANKVVLTNAETTLKGQIAEDLLALYTGAVRDEAGVEVNQGQIDAALARFP